MELLNKKWLASCSLAGLVTLALVQPAIAQQSNRDNRNDRAKENEVVDGLINDAARNNGNGNGHACVIVITESGQFGTNINGSVLSSKVANGRAGRAQIFASNGSYRLSIDPPLGFDIAPAGANPDYSMITSMMGSGATNFSETPGAMQVRLKRGSTNIEAHLAAKTTNGNPFIPGNYGSEITLRCE